ncbi:hypothetical protein B0H11DRAFT_1709600 [Mycena galericulata]|nr:hypothetical protein B0H11DRAFT_1709600 [Mycena galericulata]
MSKFPQPEKDSGQLHGENIHAFLARRKPRNEQLAKRETLQMTQKHLQREAHAVQGGPPGKKGPRVFIWEEENGFFIRRSINRSFAADRWNEFTDNQRLYDGYHNQWDLCSALAPDEVPEDDDSDYEPGEILDDSEPVYEPYHDMSEIPHTRFGFVKPVDQPRYPKRLEDRLSLKSLGDEKWPSLGDTAYEHFPSLLAYLADTKSIDDIPSDLLDLRQVDADISLDSNWVIDVSREQLNGKLFYILRPKGLAPEDCSVHLLLSSAATTLQVVRMGWGPDPQEIIFHLLQLGVEFRVCIRDRVYGQPHPQLLDAHGRLGYRRKGYKPTVVDHGVYVTLRNRFFASPRGRAARLAGGIIGRLAFGVVDDTLASVGPGSEVFETGVRLWDGSSSAAYWDDTLMDQELNIICGVYEIATGESGI